jgi:hypothetical protein
MTISAEMSEPGRALFRRIRSSLLRLIALLLLFAAAAKAYQGWRYTGISIWMIAQAGLETLLGVWLISGAWKNWAARIALATFMVFVVVTFYEFRSGISSCGCLGAIRIFPAYTFALDLSIVTLLMLQGDWLPVAPLRARWAISVCVLLTGLAALTLARNSSVKNSAPSSAMPITGPDVIAKSISPTEWMADLGTAPRGKTLRVLFNLTDPVDHDLQIRGVNVSCECTRVPKPPQVIQHTGQTQTEVIVKLPDHFGLFETAALLTTDAPNLPPLALRIRGQIQ